MDGRLTLAGAPGLLSPDMPVTQALNLTYAALVEHMDREAREECDGWLSVTAEMLPEVTADERRRRLQMVSEMGDVG
jgi:hypothetical protein